MERCAEQNLLFIKSYCRYTQLVASQVEIWDLWGDMGLLEDMEHPRQGMPFQPTNRDTQQGTYRRRKLTQTLEKRFALK